MDSKFAHLPDISTTQPDRLIKYRVSEDRFSAEVFLPGFAYTDFDQKIGGKLSLWTITGLFMTARVNAVIHGLNAIHLGSGTTYFVASQFYVIEESMSEICLVKDYHKKKPIKAFVYLARMGNTSVALVTELYDFQTGIKLGFNVTNFVHIDVHSRRPIPIPRGKLQGIDAHFKELVPIRYPEQKRSVSTVPETAYEYTLRASFSTSDANGHVTQLSYVEWCSDAASVGATSGRFRQFKKPIGAYPVKTIDSNYIGEVLVGEIVVVYVWEDQSTSNCLHFVAKKDEKAVFVCDMTFHSSAIVQSNL